eukprot:PITA_18006
MPCAAMAMKVKQLIRSMLLTFTLLTCLHLSVGQQINFTIKVANGYRCGNSQYENGTLFQLHLNQVLESMVVNVSTSGFNTSSVEGQNSNSTVYGLLQCRGDLSSPDCQKCTFTIKAVLLETCQNSTLGFIQLDGCFLLYDNHYFYNYSEGIQPYGSVCNLEISDKPETFQSAVLKLLSNITERAVRSPNLFAADVFEEYSSASQLIYSLAQCWRDLSQASYQSCLSALSNGSCSPIPSPRAASSEGKKRNVLAITLGAVAASVGLIAAICLFHFCAKRWEPISRTRGEEGEISLLPPMANLELIFKYDTLRHATSDFKAENKLGEGGFGSVFKGFLPDGREVAIKRLNIGSRQGDNQFLNEANLITRVQHRNLVRMLGCSVERSERLLVYEYLHNSSLNKIIFARYEIIVGIARGLAYLHEESEIRIIHRDIKASNILLDNKYRPKIADFGLAKLFAEDESHVSTKVAGTFGYMVPESFSGQLTEKADTWRLYNAERALEVMDPTLEGSYSWEEGIRVIKIGLLCTQAGATLRPSMPQVVLMLTGEQQHITFPTRPAFVDEQSVLTGEQRQGLLS